MIGKVLVWLHGEVKSPPFSADGRSRAGYLLRLLQQGVPLAMPESRPMPGIGPRCHELRIRDAEQRLIWRIIYRIDTDAILVVDVFAKKTQKTPSQVIDTCARRLTRYDHAAK